MKEKTVKDTSMFAEDSKEARLPLSGVVVLDLTLARAGPTCVRHRAAVNQAISEVTRHKPAAHWVEIFEAAGVTSPTNRGARAERAA